MESGVTTESGDSAPRHDRAPGFAQPPPELANTFEADDCLRENLARALPPELYESLVPELTELGALAAGEMTQLAADAERNPPSLTSYDAWGNRIDRIDVSPAWRELHRIQARLRICATPRDTTRFGEHARIVQHALLHLYGPSSAVYSCPVSMTDAAARTLELHGDDELRERVVPRLLSDNPDEAWTSAQWMTERTGGSDVGNTETVARQGADGRWRLHGHKWFTSATTADCALALARPEGADDGSAGLALFLVELVDPQTGESQVGDTILVNRLKNKLGTKALPTAELTLDGAAAIPVGEPEQGLRKVTAMLNVCRLHNAMAAAGSMRRGQQLAESYATRREAFGYPLDDLPLHRETLDAMNAGAEAAFALTFHAMGLYGRVEQGVADVTERRVLRALVPLVKLATGKAAVAHASETLECFGGAGYVEDTGLPALLRDAQVLPIWEGTTNVLSLDLMRAEQKDHAVTALIDELEHMIAIGGESNTPSGDIAYIAEDLAREVCLWGERDPLEMQAGMRSFALRLATAYGAALLICHGRHQAGLGDDRANAVAQRAAVAATLLG